MMKKLYVANFFMFVISFALGVVCENDMVTSLFTSDVPGIVLTGAV